MVQAYYYTSTAVQTQLNTGISNSALTCQVASTVGWPTQYPYVIAIDYGGTTEELCTVTANNLGLLTITRGFDNTSAQTHGIGAVVRHVYCGNDANAYRIHEGSTAGVHGVTGNVVGDTDTQTLANKTLTSSTINGAALSGTVSGSPTFSGTPTFGGGLNWTGTATGTGNLVINGSAVGTVQAVINGPSGQTADLVNWRVNAVTLAKVTAAGVFNGPGAVITGTATGTVPLQLTAANGQTVNIASVATAQGTGLTLTSNGSLSLIAPGTGNTLSASAYFSTSAIAPDSTNVMVVANYAGTPLMTLANVNVGTGAAASSFGGPMLVTSGNTATDAFTVNNTSASSTFIANLKASGVSKLTVDESGNTAISGNLSAANLTAGIVGYTPTISGGALTLGNGVMVGQYAQAGNTLFIEITITCGTTTTLAATGSLQFSMPFGTQHAGTTAIGTGYFTKTSGGSFNLASTVVGAGSSTISYFTTPSGVLNNFNTGNSAAVASGSVINLQITILL